MKDPLPPDRDPRSSASPLTEDVDPRVLATSDIFLEALAENAADYPGVYIVSADEDLDPQRFERRCPDQFVDLGDRSIQAAERAVHAAKEGDPVFLILGDTASLVSAWPIVRDEICRRRLNVKLVAPRSGFLSKEGLQPPEMVEDLALFRVLPRITVVTPADAEEAKRILRWSLRTAGPAYIRLSLYPTKGATRLGEHFEPGRASVQNPGWDVAFMVSGPLVRIALDAAEELELDSISARVLNFSTLKPIDRTAVIEAAIDTRRMVSIEEHQIPGGLGSAIAEIIAQEGCGGCMKMIGLRNEFVADVPPKDLMRHYGLTVGRLVEVARELIAAVP